MKFLRGMSSGTQGCYLSLQVMKLFLHVLDQIHSMNFLLFKNYVLFLLLARKLLNCHEGKGLEKEQYDEKIRKLHLKRLVSCGLSAEDYPLLLGRRFTVCASIYFLVFYLG